MSFLPSNFLIFDKEEQELWLEINSWLTELNSVCLVQKCRRPFISKFDLWKDREGIKIQNGYKISLGNLSFNFIALKYTVELRGGKGRVYEEEHTYFWGYIPLKENHGKALIRPENIIDKVAEYIKKTEIDFEGHWNFNRKYFVIAENKTEFEEIVKSKENLIHTLNEFSGMHLEFQGNSALFTNLRAVSKENLRTMCSLGLALDKILNKIQ